MIGATGLIGSAVAARLRDAGHRVVAFARGGGPMLRRIGVIADYLFTATAVIAQPITGWLLAREVGYSLSEGWIVLSLVLYVVTGAFWLPVVWMQSRMRDLARGALASGTALPTMYHRLFRWWFAFGFPAFTAVAAILWLMIARPEISL